MISHALGVFFPKTAPAPYEDDLRLIFVHALQALDQEGILVLAPAGNWGVGVQELHTSEAGPWRVLPQWYPPNVLTVAGTAPRDYAPDAPDLRVFAPTPGVRRGTEHNLDRPGVFEPPVYSTGFGTEGGGVDVAAPSGSRPSGAEDDPNGYFVPTRTSSASYGFHGYADGTSQAIPTAAGVAALVIEAYTEAHGRPPTLQQLKRILTGSADDRVGPATDTIYRWSADRSDSKSFVTDLTLFYMSGEASAWGLVEVDVDKPGRDDFLGFGRVNVLSAIDAAKK